MSPYRKTELQQREDRLLELKEYEIKPTGCPYCGGRRSNDNYWLKKRIVSSFDRKKLLLKERCRSCSAEWYVHPQVDARICPCCEAKIMLTGGWFPKGSY